MKYLVFFLLIFSVASCIGQKSRFITSLETPPSFTLLAGKPLSSKYGNVSSVKVIYDLDEKTLHFIPAKSYLYHFEYITEELNYMDELATFNKRNYNAGSDREFLLANLNRNDLSGSYYMDISVFDRMPVQHIINFYNLVKKAAPFTGKLRFLLNSEHLLALESQLAGKIPVITPDQLYEGLSFQAVSEGNRTGRLRFERSLDSLSAPLLPSDIVITTKTPENLPLVRGMLLTEMQTPLSHLVLLGQNRHIPIAASRSVFTDKQLRSLENQWVELNVQSDTFYIRKANVADLPENIKPVHLKKNLVIDSLIGVRSLKPALANTVGNKAANFGILSELSGPGHFKVPEAAFAIPFVWYERHMRESGAADLLKDLLANPPSDEAKIQNSLELIRERILNNPVNPKITAKIAQRLKASGFSTFRFRSSTNAEDASGFSGAGLYDSKTVDLNDIEKTPQIAMQKVWASLWSYEAYIERSFFGIVQSDVSMGILVHRSFPDEAANGVAITKNIYRGRYEGFVVNVQLGDESVVSPRSGIVCDQLVVYPANISGFQQTVEVITRSNLNKGKLVMTTAELKKLHSELDRIKRQYWRFYYSKKPLEEYLDFAVDVEFKLDKETRELYIKQVRVYNY